MACISCQCVIHNFMPRKWGVFLLLNFGFIESIIWGVYVIGREDIIINRYFSDNQRFAEIFNLGLFGGEKIVNPVWLKTMDPASSMIAEPKRGKPFIIKRYRDILKAQENEHGEICFLLGIENQDKEHFYMPVREMLYKGLTYMEQVRAIQKEHSEKKDLTVSAEFLSGFGRLDRVCPVITLVIYYGDKPWSAPKTLYEMFDTDILTGKIRKYVPDYPINLLEIRDIQNTERFCTDLNAVLGLLRYAEDSVQFMEYISQNRALYKDLAEDAYEVLAVFLKEKKLRALKKQVKTEEGIDMCKAIEMIWKDGNVLGKTEGADQMLHLVRELLLNGKIDEILEAAENAEKKQELLNDCLLKNGCSSRTTKTPDLADEQDINTAGRHSHGE